MVRAGQSVAEQAGAQQYGIHDVRVWRGGNQDMFQAMWESGPALPILLSGRAEPSIISNSAAASPARFVKGRRGHDGSSSGRTCRARQRGSSALIISADAALDHVSWL